MPQNPDDPVSQGAGRAIDRVGLPLLATPPPGERTLRVPYDEPIEDADGLRKATVKLAHKARSLLPK